VSENEVENLWLIAELDFVDGWLDKWVMGELE
jgi:hypothetical protein